MEVIAGFDGPNWSLVTVKEEGCHFTLDFQQVYWNSRLGAEHKRMVKLIQKDSARRRKEQQQENSKQPVIVADLMAGVGPFAVPLTARLPTKGKKKSDDDNARSDIVVHANDLNPASYKYLKINAEKNKCPSERLYCYNLCGRAFCHKLQDIHHAIMNLPASAPEFLDAFRGYTGTPLPRIHVYCFAPKSANPDGNSDQFTVNEDDNVHAAVLERCSTALGCPLHTSRHNVSIRIVRDVSPNKNMLCVSFDLPEEARTLPRITVPTSGKEQSQKDDERGIKRAMLAEKL
jgi:tRNA (guanine37-N1)-methyltransferase